MHFALKSFANNLIFRKLTINFNNQSLIKQKGQLLVKDFQI